MYSYSVFQWMMFFYIYCFVGWVIESVIVSVDTKTLVNRGFLRGPFLPLYGFGAIAILFSTIPVRENAFLVYIFGMLSATLLEYITGFLMESLFKMKYWDYSKYKYNIKGRVCLMASLFWGFLSLFLTYVLHSFVERIVLSIDPTLCMIIVVVVSALFLVDAVYAFRTALDVTRLLSRLTAIKEEMSAIYSQFEEKYEERREEKRSEWERRRAEASERIAELKAERTRLLGRIGFFGRNMLNAHPNAVSSKFGDALNELREKIKSRKE